MASANLTRFTNLLSFSVRNAFKYNAKSYSLAAQSTLKDKMSSKERKREEKERNMKVQSDYKDDIKKVVSRFRDERLKYRLRQAAEGEQQMLLEREKVEEKRIIEGVTIENKKLQELRKERLEIEEWTRRFKNMSREAKHLEHQEKLREMRVEMVKKAIEESKEFITAENLEEKIAFALDNETSYNFALTPNEEKIYSISPPGNTETELPGPAAYVFSQSYLKKTSERDSQEN